MNNEPLLVEEKPKLWLPRVITGGKGPPEPPWGSGENWLSEFPIGTTFVCRAVNSKDVDYNLYHVVFKRPEVVLLAWRLPDGKMIDLYVDPKRFSKKFEAPTILGFEPIAEEEKDGNSNRTDRPSDLVQHETVPGSDDLSKDPE